MRIVRDVHTGEARVLWFGTAAVLGYFVAGWRGAAVGALIALAPFSSVERILTDSEWRRKVLHAVAKRHHPDAGGLRDDWDRYEAARRLVEAGAR